MVCAAVLGRWSAPTSALSSRAEQAARKFLTLLLCHPERSRIVRIFLTLLLCHPERSRMVRIFLTLLLCHPERSRIVRMRTDRAESRDPVPAGAHHRRREEFSPRTSSGRVRSENASQGQERSRGSHARPRVPRALRRQSPPRAAAHTIRLLHHLSS